MHPYAKCPNCGVVKMIFNATCSNLCDQVMITKIKRFEVQNAEIIDGELHLIGVPVDSDIKPNDVVKNGIRFYTVVDVQTPNIMKVKPYENSTSPLE